MTEPDEATEPQVTDVPEPDQEPHEPIPDEANTTDEEEAEAAETPEPEPEPEPEAKGMSQADWEKRFQKSDKAFATYTAAISRIWEEDATDLLPVVVSPSAPPGFLNKHDAGRVPDDVRNPILEFFGISREQDYKPDNETRTCQGCDGKGKTRTGSHVAGNETRKCQACNGYGYVPPPASGANGANVTLDLHAPAGERVEPLSTGDVDNWGEPKILPDGRENPNFGKMPQFKVPIDPWGVTANLTAQDAAV